MMILSACAGESSQYQPPRLAPLDVVAAASTFLEDMDVDVSEYQLGGLSFSYTKRTWHLEFSGKSGVLHDYYWLVVEDGNINEISVLGR